MRRLHWLWVSSVFWIACGGTSTSLGPADGGPHDARVDAPEDVPGGDASADGSAGDANLSDARADGGDAGTCGTLGSGAACASCCQAAHPGSGFELVFYGSCQLCGAACADAKICSPPSTTTTGACLACLEPKLQGPSDALNQCQQSPGCAAFVSCIKTCPTN